MRYVSKNADLLLFENGGERRHQFYNHALDLGSGITIDASLNTTDPDKTLMSVFPTDLAGAKTQLLEMAGLGTIDDKFYANARNFVEAPILIAGTDSASGDKGVWYRVLTGSVTYNGTTYSASSNPFFVTDGTTTATTGTGTFSVWYPLDKCACFLTEEFKIKHMQYGDEATGYYTWEDGGFIPRNGLTTADLGLGLGYIR